MDIFDPREPVSTWTHGAWLVLALGAIAVLWRLGGPTLGKRLSLMAFGLGLALCALGSTLYHSANAGPDELDLFDRIDRCGIFALIAGTYTPIAWNLLRGPWRWGTLGPIWALALLGIGVHCAVGVPPIAVATGWYLAMGWGVLLCLRELARIVPRRDLRPLIAGGVLYSVGAVMNVAGWPAPWPGVVQAHEVFHLFVVAASAAHFVFIVRVVVPAEPEPFGPWGLPASFRDLRRSLDRARRPGVGRTWQQAGTD